MSRPTDTERGARIAYAVALERMQDLFPVEGQGRSFWSAVADEADATIAECNSLRRAQCEAHA